MLIPDWGLLNESSWKVKKSSQFRFFLLRKSLRNLSLWCQKEIRHFFCRCCLALNIKFFLILPNTIFLLHKMWKIFLYNFKYVNYKDWGLENNTNLNSIFCLIKSSKKYFIFLPAFNLIMWLMTSPKNFEKIAILKKW